MSEINIELESERKRPGVIISFLRSQVSAGFGNALDFVISCLFHRFGQLAIIATFFGATIGGIVHFFFSRFWSFKADHIPIQGQAIRFLIANVSSIGLNMLGVYLTHGLLDVNFPVARLGVSFFVGFFFNFPIQRWYVFKWKWFVSVTRKQNRTQIFICYASLESNSIPNATHR